MACIMEKEMTVLPSVCDDTARLSIPSIFSIFMDLASEHGEIIGVGGAELQKKGLFWLTVKTKIKIYDCPEMMAKIKAQTWPEAPERIRANRYYLLTDGQKPLAEGKSEWAIISTEDGKLHRIDEVYPSDIDHYENKVCNEPFRRMSDDFSDCETFCEYTVKSTDIDLGKHMNNAAYMRAIFGAFSCKEIEEMNISEAEIAFKSPCFEREKLAVKIKKIEEEILIAMIKEDGKTAVVARLLRKGKDHA